MYCTMILFRYRKKVTPMNTLSLYLILIGLACTVLYLVLTFVWKMDLFEDRKDIKDMLKSFKSFWKRG